MKNVFFGVLMIFCSVLSLSAQTNNNERNFQLGFVSPLGTNGLQSHLITNKFSINILGGYSAGNRILELGSLYNVNINSTKGVQLAGVLNYTGKSMKSTQFAGVINIVKSGESSFQGAGIANFSQKIKGVQEAGLINVASETKGVQIAGAVNVANKVKGVQVAGVVNIADKVDGVQFGLINIANSYEGGAPIGLVNIVKENGKHEIEVGFSDDINSYVSFKLGTDRFYTIFSGGANYIYDELDYAAGLGFGTNIHLKKGWENQIEIMGYQLTENGKFEGDLNMLTQVKYSFSKVIAKYLKVFAGPVLNITVSDYVNPSTKEIGCSLSPWSIWSNNSGSTKVNVWIGFSAGIRF